MYEKENILKSLVLEQGMSSSEITHTFKIGGGGNMQDGIKQFANLFFKEGYKLGEKNGIIKGTAGTLFLVSLVLGGYYITEKYKSNKEIKKHEKESIKILDIMKSETPTEADMEENQELQIDNK